MLSPLLRRLVGFASVPLLIGAAPLLVLPVIARQGTAAEWVAIAVGSSVGGLAAIVVSLGWSTTGPLQVATRPTDRSLIYYESLWSRLVAFVVAAPAGCLITSAIVDEAAQALAIAMTLAVAINGLSPAWFSVGMGKPSDVAIFDGFPRLVAAGAAAGLIGTGYNLIFYPLAAGAMSVTTIVAYTLRVTRWNPAGHQRIRLWRVVGKQAATTATTLISASYTTAMVPLVAWCTTTSEAAIYASGTRLYQFAFLGVAAASQSLITETRLGQQTPRHLRTALSMHAAVGSAGALVILAFGPQLTRILLTAELDVTQAITLPLSCAFLLVSANMFVIQQVLIPRGNELRLLPGALAGATIGVPATLMFAQEFGAVGGAWGLVTAEASALLGMTLSAHRARAAVRPV